MDASALIFIVLLLFWATVAAFLLVRAPARTQVADETVVRLPAAEVERRLFGPIAAIRWARTTSASPGQLALASSYTPGWTVVVAIVFFPIGLLALLVRPKLVLYIRFLDEGSSLPARPGRGWPTRSPTPWRV